MTLTGSYFDTYSTIEKMSPSFGYSVASICFNTISDIHFMYYKDIYLTMSRPNYQVTEINMFGLDFTTDIYHMQNIFMSKLFRNLNLYLLKKI